MDQALLELFGEHDCVQKRWCEHSMSLGLKPSLNPELLIHKSPWEFTLKIIPKICPPILKGWKYDFGITH